MTQQSMLSLMVLLSTRLSALHSRQT